MHQTVTTALLQRLGACADQIEIVEREWPAGVPVTATALDRAYDLGIDAGWLVSHRDCPLDVRDAILAVATRLRGYVLVHKGATLSAPALAQAGYVLVREGATLSAPVLATVTGYVLVHEGATLSAPALATVTGYVLVHEGATLSAPLLRR